MLSTERPGIHLKLKLWNNIHEFYRGKRLPNYFKLQEETFRIRNSNV